MFGNRLRRRGAVAVQTAMSVGFLAGFAALAIDTGRMFTLRGEMQRSVDASALAGASSLEGGESDVHAAAYGLAAGNDVNLSGLIQSEAKIQIGRWDGLNRRFTETGYSEGAPTPNAVKVDGFRAGIPLYLAPLFGTNATRVGRRGTALMGGGKCAGVWGLQGVRTHGDIYTDSYNSTEGHYGEANVYRNGDLCSCMGVDVMGDVEINGDVMYDQDYSVDISGSTYAITGVVDDFPCSVTLPPFDIDAARANNDNDTLVTESGRDPIRGHSNQLMLTDDEVMRLSSGRYYFSSVAVVGQAHIEILGNVEIYIDGDATFGGGGIVNVLEDPAALTIYSTGNDLKLAGGNNIYGAIIAPDADITIIGGGTIYGAMLGRTVEIGGDATIHVDEAVLLNLYGVNPRTPILVE